MTKGMKSVVAIIVACCSLMCAGQSSPCPTGTLANVLGTSCTIGPLTFNFQTFFNANTVAVDLNNNSTLNFFTRDQFAFTPIVNATQAGFQITTNFSDDPGNRGLLSSSQIVEFFYNVQANGTAQIFGETASLVGAVGQGGPGDVIVIDRQLTPDQQLIPLQARLFFDPNSGLFSLPVDTDFLLTPITGTLVQTFDPANNIEGTVLATDASGAGQAGLTSGTLLYTLVAPPPPPPPPPPPQPPPTLPAANLIYTTIDIPQAQLTFPEGINNSGQIVGAFTDSSGVTHGYLADKGGNLSTVIDFPNAAATFLAGINENGDIVGGYQDSNGTGHGFLLRNSVFSTVDFPGAASTFPSDINNQDESAGFYQDADLNFHGFILGKTGFATIDDPLQGSPSTQLFCVNNRNTVGGVFTDSTGFIHNFLFQHGAFQTIDVPGDVLGASSVGLNDNGDIVGSFGDADFNQHGFLLNNKVFFRVDFPGSPATFPFQINADRSIVGVYFDSNFELHGFLARKSTGVVQEAPSTGTASVQAAPGQQLAAPHAQCVVGRLSILQSHKPCGPRQ